MYKSSLQIFCQRKKWMLPVYSATKDGPDHRPHFFATVTVNGTSFASEVAANSAKEAQNEAARVALLQLGSADASPSEISYKNLLQELAQKKCFLLPVYVTTRAGDVHASTFVSTVEVNQQVFTGIEARTKKLAEMSAANVAYTNLKECRYQPLSVVFMYVLVWFVL
ncbi:unnamed protein product [Linum tenue]|uniref:DRBM domain-containing protein n=1 Tax=Linum tenue TaxID=586396 RepID=A0AAV0LEC9_9ROSI|nr:unnamed protein product [Linum tenue]